MADEWMIDVLADLRQYAIRHYHLKLAEQLDDAIVVAAQELRVADRAEADLDPGRERGASALRLAGRRLIEA